MQTLVRLLAAALLCLPLGVAAAGSPVTDVAAEAADLGIPLQRLPWHLADVWWEFTRDTPGFTSLDVDVTLDRDLPDGVCLYVSPVGIARINGLDFYGGLQTSVNGWASRTERTRVFRGPGAIFSRWSRDKEVPIGLEHVRMAADGLCESAGYEGEFCSVRRPFAWGRGTFTYSIVKGDSESGGHGTNTWFHCLVRRHSDGVTHYVGSLRFEGSDFTYWNRHSAFVEVYATTQQPRSPIPHVTIRFAYPRINGVAPPLRRASVLHNRRPERGAIVPPAARTRAEGSSVVVELGPLLRPDPATHHQELPLEMPR